jgi:hypothetical protein
MGVVCRWYGVDATTEVTRPSLSAVRELDPWIDVASTFLATWRTVLIAGWVEGALTAGPVGYKGDRGLVIA